ncbi:hypothetical protein AJ78_04982 [Emergomyces pasteurianus Ep9510]|uniref:Uncharacterized protein n=1 Tax=Emergomyces pasteurianus Ep9510 TaxID=1447872 RepID=A0A1J9Q3B5_9EURO|nr:hypothetical protein AJ78_04982 [Emergomyces pasteurianus Ep9510]
MARKVTHEVRERRAREAGFNPDKSVLSKKRVIRELDSSTASGYKHMWEVWEEYCEMYNNRDIFDEQVEKNFIIYTAKISQGNNSKKDSRPKPSYLWQQWKRFTAE